MKNNKPFKSQKKLTHNILLLTLNTLASVCKFSILHSMHFLRCSLVRSVTKTSPLPFYNTQIFILKLPLRVYMKHCRTTKKEIWIQVQPKHCYELFWLLTIWCGTQALMLSLWLINLVSTHVAQRGPTTGPFCTPHSILKSRFFLNLSYISSYLSLYVRDSIVPPLVPASEPEPHRSNKENLSNNQVLLKLVIICVILMTLICDSGVIL